MRRSTVVMVSFSRVRIQRSAGLSSTGPPAASPGWWVARERLMKRAVFQILLAKLRLLSTRSSDRFRSLPGVPPVSSEKRRASVP